MSDSTFRMFSVFSVYVFERCDWCNSVTIVYDKWFYL